jgi:hypothetical protein
MVLGFDLESEDFEPGATIRGAAARAGDGDSTSEAETEEFDSEGAGDC